MDDWLKDWLTYTSKYLYRATNDPCCTSNFNLFWRIKMLHNKNFHCIFLFLSLLSITVFQICKLTSKFLYFSNPVNASKVDSSGRITTKQKNSKSIFAKNITSNDLLRLPEGQHTQSSTFSIFEIFVLPTKIFMLQ